MKRIFFFFSFFLPRFRWLRSDGRACIQFWYWVDDEFEFIFFLLLQCDVAMVTDTEEFLFFHFFPPSRDREAEHEEGGEEKFPPLLRLFPLPNGTRRPKERGVPITRGEEKKQVVLIASFPFFLRQEFEVYESVERKKEGGVISFLSPWFNILGVFVEMRCWGREKKMFFLFPPLFFFCFFSRKKKRTPLSFGFI